MNILKYTCKEGEFYGIQLISQFKNILRKDLYPKYIKNSCNSVIKKTKQKTKVGIKFEQALLIRIYMNDPQVHENVFTIVVD